MCTLNIPAEDYDSLRSVILEAGGKLELLVYHRLEGESLTVYLATPNRLPRALVEPLAAAVSRHFDGKVERYRLTTKFSLEALSDVPGIFLAYYAGDYLLTLERGTFEVPFQVLQLVEFLEDAYEARVEFVFGKDPLNLFEGSEFVLHQVADMGGFEINVHGSQDASPSLDFIRGVGGEYLEHLMSRGGFPDGGLYRVDLKLERDNYGVRHFRMFYKDQRFFSIERDKLVEEKP